MKQPHKEIYEERLATVLRPFSNLLKTNMRYSAFEAMYDSPESREILEFKHKTLLDEFCKDFQECLRILHEVEGNIDKQIVANPNVRRIFNKLSIEKWQENKIQFFYLSKLRSTFFTMRNHLIKLFVKGIDYWKIPLSNNQQFLEDVRKLIDCELICERLLGDDLKRDQLNFVFDNLAIVLESKGKEKMLKKEELITKISVPKLLVFKTLQKMRSILDLKKKDQTKDHIEKKQGGAFFQFSVIPIQEDPNENEEILASALKSPFLKTSQKSPGKKEDEEEEEKLKKIEEVERKKYGRYFIWEDYVDETNKNLFLNTVEELRHINIAVQQDIQDKIITEGLNAPTSYLEHRDLYMEEVKKTREFLSNLYAEDNKKDAINNIRPPIVWNHPKVWEDNHQYRSIANPQECYKDNRIQSILQTIEILGKHLSTYKKDHFEELINRVIDCFNSEYNAKLNPLSIY